MFIVAMAMWCAPVAQAQDFDPNDEPKNELAVGYGAVSSSNVLDVFVDVVSAMFGARYQNDKFLGPFSAEYFYHVSPLVGVGGIGVYNHHSQDVLQSDEVTGERTSDYITIMPAVKFNWLRKNHWGLYSKAAVGASLSHSSEEDYDDNGKLNGEKKNSNDVFFNFQATLIGVEAGSRQVRGFFELGVGEQGILLGGVRYKF